MKKFEYKTLYHTNISELNDLGKQGWELIGFFENHAYLKREIPEFVLLEGIEYENQFFFTNIPSKDPTKSLTVETLYKILGYANSIPEAQLFFYGKTYSQ